MKELKDYRDEIFRRSDEKKQKIRKRRRIAIGVGIPLCLCCVLTVAVLPGGLRKADLALNMESASNAGIMEDAETVMEHFNVTDPSKVNQILLLLDGVTAENDGDSKQNYESADRVTSGSYRLTLTLSDGSRLVYHIEDDHAYCETTGETVTLSASQTEALYELVSGNR